MSNWLGTPFFALLGLLGMASMVLTIAGRLLETGFSGVLENVTRSVEFVVLSVRVGVSYLTSFVPEGALPEGIIPASITDTYAQALIASFVISVSYAQALSILEQRHATGVFGKRRYLAPVAILIFSLTLVGLSLFITIIRDALKGEKELQIAIIVFQRVFVLLASLVAFAGINLAMIQ